MTERASAGMTERVGERRKEAGTGLGAALGEIPAVSAGMTEAASAGMTEWGAGMVGVGARV